MACAVDLSFSFVGTGVQLLSAADENANDQRFGDNMPGSLDA